MFNMTKRTERTFSLFLLPPSYTILPTIFQSKRKHYMYTKQNTISCDLIKIVHSDPIHHFLYINTYISIIKAVQKLIMFTILVLTHIRKCRWVHLVYYMYSPIVYKLYEQTDVCKTTTTTKTKKYTLSRLTSIGLNHNVRLTRLWCNIMFVSRNFACIFLFN